MRSVFISLILACVLTPAFAQEKGDGPANEKAKKAYQEALQYLHQGQKGWALDSFKKADKEDGGNCLACQKQMIQYGRELGEWKAAELAVEEMVSQARDERDAVAAHYQLAVVLFDEGLQKHKDEIFSRVHDEITKVLAVYPTFAGAVFLDGRALACRSQQSAAIARFEQYVKMKSADDPDRQRALLYISRPELARARMAPPFAVTTADGTRISMDDLQGKVVLLDFWAVWCGPCRAALPHIQEVARKFQGQPLVILSVSLDADERKWREFVEENDMTWPQYRDGGFSGPIAKMFGVEAIPHTFTIDADGVLQDEHIGDASIEGRLKKLLARARDLQSTRSR
jgi:peroxiredoxin